MKSQTLSTDERGFSLVEVMVAIGLMSIVSFGIMTMMESFNKERARTNFLTSAQVIRTQLYKLVEDKDSWQQIYSSSSNTIFECLRNGKDCTSKESGLIAVLDQVGTVVYDPRLHGYTFQGLRCDLSLGPSVCPIKVEVKTTLICSQETCQSPAVKTVGTMMLLSNPYSFAFNQSAYSFESYRTSGNADGGFIAIITVQDILDEVIKRRLKVRVSNMAIKDIPLDSYLNPESRSIDSKDVCSLKEEAKSKVMITSVGVRHGYILYGQTDEGKTEDICKFDVVKGSCDVSKVGSPSCQLWGVGNPWSNFYTESTKCRNIPNLTAVTTEGLKIGNTGCTRYGDRPDNQVPTLQPWIR